MKRPKNLSIRVVNHRAQNIILIQMIINFHFPNQANLFTVSAGKEGDVIDIQCPDHKLAKKLNNILFGAVSIPTELLRQTATIVSSKNSGLIH